MLVTVVGATGKTGKVAAERLLAAGIQVRAVGRSVEHLAPLVKSGAQPVIAEVTRAPELAVALRGADAAYLLVPPKFDSSDPLGYYDQVNGALATAIVESGVKRVVYLSSQGADLPSGTGPIVGLHRGEERLKALPGLDVLFLRPGYFYENHFGALGLVKQQGINGGAFAPNTPICTIAARDIGEAAASALTRRDFSGSSVRELFGPRDLSMAEATSILGGKIGKPDLKYIQFPDQGFVEGMKSAGFSEALALLFAEMAHAFDEGKIKTQQKRTPANTGATSFDDFAETWSQTYQST
jgi:uncharacterized protein YbjT (DUF2867 family)